MTTIKICGVPEHFNLPWEMCLQNNEFKNQNIDVQWTNVPEGTGKMCQLLRNKQTDIAIILTEGIIKDIIAGNNAKIVQIYVNSPLIWGIHVAAHSNFTIVDELHDKNIAISRLGSGSHLMALVHAKNKQWDTQKINFDVVNTLDAAAKHLAEQPETYFMWEKFMTQPFVDNGIFRRIGECPTPWPCFVIAVRNEILENHLAVIQKILDVINTKTAGFKTIKDIDVVLAAKYNQKLDHIHQWLSLTTWSQKKMNEKSFNTIQNQLFELNIIDKKTTFANAVH